MTIPQYTIVPTPLRALRSHSEITEVQSPASESAPSAAAGSLRCTASTWLMDGPQAAEAQEGKDQRVLILRSGLSSL